MLSLNLLLFLDDVWGCQNKLIMVMPTSCTSSTGGSCFSTIQLLQNNSHTAEALLVTPVALTISCGVCTQSVHMMHLVIESTDCVP